MTPNGWRGREAELAAAIRASLDPGLLNRAWRAAGAQHPLAGHCYVASEAAWHCLGGKDSGWSPMVGRDESGNTHWWLRGRSGAVLDPTAGQYTDLGMAPPYSAGRPCGFLTRAPSRRARVVLARLREASAVNGPGPSAPGR